MKDLFVNRDRAGLSEPVSTGSEDRLQWRIELLGWFRAQRGNDIFTKLQTRKTAVLLAYLALYRQRSHPREELACLLWPESTWEVTRDRLNQALSVIRRALEPESRDAGIVLMGDRHSVQLNPNFVTTDVAIFDELSVRALSFGEGTSSVEQLRVALSHYRGDLLPGMYDEWILSPRQRLTDLHVRARSLLARQLEEQEEYDEAIECLRELVKSEPLQEEHHFSLIRLFGKSHQSGAAQRQYQELERILKTELGEEPSPATKTLLQQICSRGVVAASTEFEHLEEVEERPRRRPLLPLTKFFGRDEEIAHISTLLDEGRRLVTLTGMAGCGKTRLALEVTRSYSASFPGDVCLVPLADLRDSDEVGDAILRSLVTDRSPGKGVTEQILEALQGSEPILLILDNFEHLSETVTSLVSNLLAQCSILTVLVTSRQRLGIEGEQEVRVPTLPVPDAQHSVVNVTDLASMQLFLDRTRLANPSFAINDQNIESVRQLRIRLEGLPLAIELAAAWAQTMTPAQMVVALDHRFTWLISRRRDIGERHRTLRAAIEHSAQLLTEDQRSFFTRLCIFQGGWTVEAARVVCSEPRAEELLVDLVERSLVVAEEVWHGSTSTVRYRMLETLREYGQEELSRGESAVLSGEHSDYFIHWATQAQTHLSGPGQAEWFARIEHELQNLTAALRWCLASRQTALGLELASAMTPYWEVRGPLGEGRHWLEQLLRLDDASPSCTAKALAALGNIAWQQTDLETSASAHLRSLQLYRQLGDSAGVASSLYHLGLVRIMQGNYPEARSLMQDSLRQAGEMGDKAGVARALLNLGNISCELEELSEAKKYYERALVCEKSLGNRERAAGALNNLGDLARIEGQPELARFYFNETLQIAEQLRSQTKAIVAHLNLGSLASSQRSPRLAADHLLKALSMAREIGRQFLLMACFSESARVLGALGKLPEAATLLSACETLQKELGAPLAPNDHESFDQALALVTERLEPGVLDTAWAAGSLLSDRAASEFAIDCLREARRAISM